MNPETPFHVSMKMQSAEGGAALWNDDRSVLLEFRQQ